MYITMFFFYGQKSQYLLTKVCATLRPPFSMSFQPISIIFELLKSSVSEFFESDFFWGFTMLLITKIFSSIVITMSGFKIFKIIQISVYRVLFGCQGSHISSKVLSLETERGCRYRVRVHDATDHKNFQ